MYCEIKEKVSSLRELEQFKTVACLSLKNGIYTKVLEKIWLFFFPCHCPHTQKHTEAH